MPLLSHRRAPVLAALLLSLPATVLVAPPAAAEFYRWTDERGNLHFAQSLDQVPARYRAQARQNQAAPRAEAVQTYAPPAPPPPAARQPSARTGGTLRIPFERQGTLMVVQARLNDHVTAPFFIDTGASGISLPQAIATELGFRPGPDTKAVRIGTANGVIAVPTMELDSVQLGPARVEHIEATVNPTMTIGLLGGAFFNNFVYQVDAAESVITLAPNESIRGGLDAEGWRERFRGLREPLAELEAYLDRPVRLMSGRQRELEANRARLRAELEALEDQANRLGVPAAWRQ